MTALRYVVLSASMGSGHDGVADELARRITGRGRRAWVIDLLDVMPVGTGRLMRAQYAAMLRHRPESYERIYQRFAEPAGALHAVRAVLRLATPAVGRMLASLRPDVVVSTFHLAGAITARLRRPAASGPGAAWRDAAHRSGARGAVTQRVAGRDGAGFAASSTADRFGTIDRFGAADRLGTGAVPGIAGWRSLVLLTEFAPHGLWLAPGNDAYCCPSPGCRRLAAEQVGGRAHWVGPLVRDLTGTGRPAVLAEAGDRPPVLLCAGAWGMGDALADLAARLCASGRYFPLVLCGRNRRLREAVAARAGDRHALGWVDDVGGLLRHAYAVVDNSGGLSATEAFAAGVPVVLHAPLAGHGRASRRQLTHEGLVYPADTGDDVLAGLDTLRPGGRPRAAQVARAHSVFRPDAADRILSLAETGCPLPEPAPPAVPAAHP